MRDTETASRIRQFIDDNFLFQDDGMRPGDEESLLEAGLVDSTGILELVTFIEGTFGIRVADAEIIPDNLDSIAAIAAYVSGKLLASAPAAA